MTTITTEKFTGDWPPRIVVCAGTAVLRDNKTLLIRQAEGTSLAEPVEPWRHWLIRRVLRHNYHLIPEEPDNPQQPKTAFF